MADINQTTQAILQINGKQADQTMKALKQRAEELRESIDKASKIGDVKQVEKLNKELKNTNSALRSIQSTTKNVSDVMGRLDKASPKELRDTLNVLQKQLKGMERGSAAWTAQTTKIKQVKAVLQQVNEELKVHETFMQRLNRTFNNWGQSIMAAAASLTGIVMAGKKAVQTYAEMDQEMANVRKYTGMTAEQVEQLNEQFKKMDTRTSRDELNKLAQEAGRLGKSSEEDVMGFVKAADKINVALDELGEGATLTLSKLTNIFGDEAIYGTEQSLLKVGSVINELSQNSTASASYLAEFAQRLAGVGAQAGMTIPQIMGFAAVLDSNGQAVEMSASALSKLIMNLFKQADKIAAATGLNLQKFKETAAKDTNEALIMLLERLHELGNMDALAPLFKEMGENGVRSSQVLAALAGNIEAVKQQQLAANAAFEEGISIDKEFEVQNTTVQTRLEKAKKGFQEMAVTLGKELMPIVSHLISGTSATMRVLLKTIQFIKEYRTVILSTTAAITAYYAVVKAQDAWNAVVKGAKTAAAAVKAFNAALAANPWGMIAAAVAAIAVAVGSYVKKMREAKEAADVIGNANRKAAASFAEEKAKVDQLNAAVHNETLSLQYRQKALKELQSIVPGYHASLTQEGKLINDNKDAINDYLVALQKKLQMQAYQDMLAEKYAEKAKKEMELDEAKIDRDNKQLAWAKIDGNNSPLKKDIAYNKFRRANDKVGDIESDIKAADEGIEKLTKKISEMPAITVDINPTTNPTDGGGTNPTNSEPTNPTDSPAKDRFKEEEDWLKREHALNEIAYAQGKISYQEYTHGKLELEEQFQAKRLAKCEKGTTEYLEVMAAHEKAVAALDKSCTTSTIEEENERWSGVKAILDQRYADGEMSARAYQNATELAELEHLQNLVNIYEEGSKERLKAQENYNRRSRQIQQKHIEDDRRMQEQMKKEYFSNSRWQIRDDEGYGVAKQNMDAVYQQLSSQQMTNQERLKLDQAYHEARYQLARKYNQKEEAAQINSAHAAFDDIYDFMHSEGMEKFTSAFGAITNQMGQMFSAVSSLVEAETEIQTAAIERRYNKEIEAAEGNKSRTTALEKKKQDEIAKQKSEASKKMFSMQVFQAIAEGAMGAITAWNTGMQAGFPAGLVLAPLLMAMSITTTGIQIAALKKQQEAAASTGYAKGRKGGKGEYALIGEEGPEVMYIPQGASIVPNNKLQSPQEWEQYGVPTFSAIDEAQRTNTLGSLSRRDVSRSISAPQVIAETTAGGQLQAGMAAQATTNAETAKAIARLNKRLNEPFVTVNTVTGDKGIRQAQDNYDRLMKNATRKSK